jgi:hypothetical protein
MASYWRRRGQPRGGPARAQVPPASLVLASAWVRHSAWHATLFAALDITNGRVLAQCRARHRHPELLGFPSISTPTYRRPSMSTSSSTITSRTNPPKCLSGSPAGPVSTSLSHRLIHPAQSGPALVRFTHSARSAADRSSVPKTSFPKSRPSSMPIAPGSPRSCGRDQRCDPRESRRKSARLLIGGELGFGHLKVCIVCTRRACTLCTRCLLYANATCQISLCRSHV